MLRSLWHRRRDLNLDLQQCNIATSGQPLAVRATMRPRENMHAVAAEMLWRDRFARQCKAARVAHLSRRAERVGERGRPNVLCHWPRGVSGRLGEAPSVDCHVRPIQATTLSSPAPLQHPFSPLSRLRTRHRQPLSLEHLCLQHHGGCFHRAGQVRLDGPEASHDYASRLEDVIDVKP